MSCLISEGLNQKLCTTSIGGIKKVYIANTEDVESYTDTVLNDGIINAVVMVSGELFYEFEIDKSSSNATCVQAGANNKYFTHTVDFFVSADYDKAAIAANFLRLGKFVVIVEMLDGTKILYGSTADGLSSTVVELNTGTASDDKSALHVTLSGDQLIVAQKFMGTVPIV